MYRKRGKKSPKSQPPEYPQPLIREFYKIYNRKIDKSIPSQLEELQHELQQEMQQEQPQAQSKLLVMQYNILAPTYLTPTLRARCGKKECSWEYRSRMIVAEILSYAPSILCLQEIEQRHFEEYFTPQLGSKPTVVHPDLASRSKPLEAAMFVPRDCGLPDGCAIFYDPEVLRPVGEGLEEPESLKYLSVIDFDDLDHFGVEYITHNIAQIMLFENLDAVKFDKGARYICVANAHLFWDPLFDYVKVKQAKYLLDKVTEFVEMQINNLNCKREDIGVIICGDFNSLPQSDVYRLYSKGTSGDLSHDLDLESAYSSIGEPQTNLTWHFKGTLDYIWFSRQHWTVDGLLSPAKADKNLPNLRLPSDHTAIVARICPK